MLADELSGTHYYRVPSLLNTMTKWFYDHDSQFESLKYDFFIFMSQYVYQSFCTESLALCSTSNNLLFYLIKLESNRDK